MNKAWLPILTYHYFHSDDQYPADIKREDYIYSIEKKTFQLQLEYLKANKMMITDPAQSVGADDDCCLITIDDGHISGYDVAFELLCEAGCRAIFFICPGMIGRKNNMTWEMVDEMSRSGMVFGSHTFTHRPLVNLTEKELDFELLESRQMIEDRVGTAVDSIALPMGYSDKKTVEAILCRGYRSVFSSIAGYNVSGKGPVWQRFMVKQFSSSQFEKLTRYTAMDEFYFLLRNSCIATIKGVVPGSFYKAIRAMLINLRK